MNESLFILDDKILKIDNIIYKNGELSITTSNNYMLNINLNIEKINNEKILTDLSFVTQKYSYLIDIGNNALLTKFDNNYLLEIDIPKVNILIPPFDNINKKRLESNISDEVEIHKLKLKVYFNKE